MRESVKVLQECIDLQTQKANDYQNPNSKVKQADYYPNGVMMRYGNFNSQKAKVFNLIRSYGFKTDYDDYVHYLQNILKVIDDNTPLN